MTSETAESMTNLEYDWLACDARGLVALFTTGGSGYAPPALLRDTDAYDEAIDQILSLVVTTKPIYAPEVARGRVNTWRLVAERGFFAFDAIPLEEDYSSVAAPMTPILVDQLPDSISRVVRQVVLGNVSFVDTKTITAETLRGYLI